MNYPYPVPGSNTNPFAFTATNTGQLGLISQTAEARTTVTIDYSQLVPAVNVQSFSFRVKPGGSPQLRMSGPFLTPASPIGKSLAFMIDGGIPGKSYSVSIDVATDIGTRTDVLNISIEGDDCGCAYTPTPPTGFGGETSGDGSVFVNTAPRFFVSSTIPVGGKPLDRWYDTTSGDVYDCITNGIVSYWTLSIPAGGSAVTPISTASIIKIAQITPNGSTRTFTLIANTGVPVNVISSETLFVSLDGVWQEPLVEYIATTNQVTFATAPDANSQVFMVWFAAPTDVTTGGDGANILKLDPITPDGVTITFILNSSQPVEVTGSNSLFVSIDGAWQESGVDYVASVNLITFIEAPRADSKIFMLWFAPPPAPPLGG